MISLRNKREEMMINSDNRKLHDYYQSYALPHQKISGNILVFAAVFLTFSDVNPINPP